MGAAYDSVWIESADVLSTVPINGKTYDVYKSIMQYLYRVSPIFHDAAMHRGPGT